MPDAGGRRSVPGLCMGAWRRAGVLVSIRPWRRLSTGELEAVEIEVESLPLPDIRGRIRVRWDGGAERSGLSPGRLRLRSELQQRLTACEGAVSLARKLQGAHRSKCHAPAEEPLCVHIGRRGKPLDAHVDRLEIVHLPEDQVDGVERGIAEARCRIDRDEAALSSTVEDVAGRQVTVKQDDREARCASAVASMRPRS